MRKRDEGRFASPCFSQSEVPVCVSYVLIMLSFRDTKKLRVAFLNDGWNLHGGNRA